MRPFLHCDTFSLGYDHKVMTTKHKILDRNPINVALIGYGFAGKTFHAPLISAVRGLRLRYIASSDAAKVRKDWPKTEVIGYDEVFAKPDIDLIVIATPNTSHFDLAQKALNAGKHSVVDKPFTTTVSEAEQLIALAAKQKRLLSVYQSRRWDGDFLTLRKVFAARRLGDVMYFESRYDRFRSEIKKRWRETPGPASGIWYDLGAHLADQALQLFGIPDSIYADLAMQRPGSTTVDYFHVLLGYENKRIVLHGSSLVIANGPRFFIHGTRGSFVKNGMDTQEDMLKAGKKPTAAGFGKDPLKGVLTLQNGNHARLTVIPNLPGRYLGYYEALRDAILGEGPNPVTGEQALAVMKVLELAVKSAEQKREIVFA
jgi:scyllo-inositol 2-dehydrogenase (NADP+)